MSNLLPFIGQQLSFGQALIWQAWTFFIAADQVPFQPNPPTMGRFSC